MAFHEGVKDLFSKYSKLESFSWRQYTPYFNDGDTCEFEVYNDYLDMVWDGEEQEDVGRYSFLTYDSTTRRHMPKKDRDVELEAAYNDMQEFLDIFDPEDFRALFGDHVRITVYSDSIEVNDYDHE